MSSLPIFNANQITLDNSGIGLPNMSSAILGWMQKMTLSVKSQSTSDGILTETFQDFQSMGCIQPLGPSSLKIKPEGQRNWQWYRIYLAPIFMSNAFSSNESPLKTIKVDDIIKYKDINYRVMDTFNYDSYGYIEYHCVKGFAS